MVGTKYSEKAEAAIFDANMLLQTIETLPLQIEVLRDGVNQLTGVVDSDVSNLIVAEEKLSQAKRQMENLKFNLLAIMAVLMPVEARLLTIEQQSSVFPDADDDIPF